MDKVIFGLVTGIIVVLVMLAGVGGADDDLAQLAAERTERTAIEQAERTQREAIAQEGRTERAYISSQQVMWLATEREATLRLVLVLLLVVVVSVAAVALAVAWLRKPSGGQGNEGRYLLTVQDRLPPGWIVVRDPAFGWIARCGDEYMLPSDVRALLREP